MEDRTIQLDAYSRAIFQIIRCEPYNHRMPMPILATKLHIPPLRSKVVPRPHLIDRLNDGLRRGQGFGHKLTLVSAPAGFGKTTIVSEWLASNRHPVAWLSLDEGDNDLKRFLAYLVAALQTLPVNISDDVLGLLRSPQL